MNDPLDAGASYAERVRADVAEFGCHIAALTDDDGQPMCAFTVGLLTTHGHPEVVVFGLELDKAEDLLDIVQEQVEAGARFEPGPKYDNLLRTYHCVMKPVAARHVPMFTAAVEFHGRSDVPMLQLFWPDRQGRYPWEPGVREGFRQGQPVLEREVPWE